MKRVIVIAVMLLLFTGCSADVPASKKCVLCNAFPRHAPCLVDLNSGKICELEIYQPHHTKVAELSVEQYGGYMSLVQFGDINGILLGADRVELEAPAKATGIRDTLFCKDCRKLLKDSNCQGYILADLCTPDAPTMWQIEYGTSFSVRCYEVQICQGNEVGKLKILMIGTLETNDSTLKNTGDVLP